MASPPVQLGSETLMTFSGFTAPMVSARWTSINRVAPNSTSMQSPPGGFVFAGEFLAGEAQAGGEPIPPPSESFFARQTYLSGKAINPGLLECTFHHNPDTLLPLHGQSGSAVVTWPSGAVWSGTGFWRRFDVESIDIDGIMTLQGQFQFSGPITVTGAP